MGQPATAVAAIDVGTNSVLLTVARRGADGSLEVVRDRATITRIGRGVDRTGTLAPAGIEASLEVLQDYVREARAHGATKIAAVGTSALRDARNGDAFLKPAAGILGSEVEVITGDREARLTFLGATRGLDLDHDEVTVLDVGGGSTEVVRGRGRLVHGAVSLNVGSVRLLERHVHHDPPRMEELRAAGRAAEETLSSGGLQLVPPLIGIAGTVTTLAAMLQGLDEYDPARIHGARIEPSALDDLIERMAAISTEERARLPGLDPRRADVIIVGAVIVQAAIAQAGGGAMIVSNGGVRLGLVDELLGPRDECWSPV
ncbi:MAG: Ppx/GppA family phosphatase [Myxococcota bacterium]